MMKFLSFALVLLLLFSGAAFAEPLPQEDYYGRYMAATTEEERQAVLDEMPDTRYAAYDAESGRWGLIDRVGRWVVEPAWDWLETFAYGDYSLATSILNDEMLEYSIIDRNGNTVAIIDDTYSEYYFSDVSSTLEIAQWDDDRILLFDAAEGRFLNEKGYISGNKANGYQVSLFYRAYDYDLPTFCYLLSSTGERMGNGYWFLPDSVVEKAVPSTQPDAQAMTLVCWDDAQWKFLVDEFPEVNEFCDGDFSFAEDRQNGYHLLDDAGNIVFSSDKLEDFTIVPSSYEGFRIFAPSQEGLYWDDSTAGSLVLKDRQDKPYYSMEYEEWSTDLRMLTPQENIFLVWDEEGLYGYLHGDGTLLYSPCFDEADLFVDGLAKVSWFSDDWTEEEHELYTICEDSGPFHPELPAPSYHCFAYIDTFGNVIYSTFGIYHLP